MIVIYAFQSLNRTTNGIFVSEPAKSGWTGTMAEAAANLSKMFEPKNLDLIPSTSVWLVPGTED